MSQPSKWQCRNAGDIGMESPQFSTFKEAIGYIQTEYPHVRGLYGTSFNENDSAGSMLFECDASGDPIGKPLARVRMPYMGESDAKAAR